MARYVLTPAARDDLLEIADYIAADDPTAASRVLRRVRKACRLLGRMPGAGHLREDVADASVRFWPVGSLLIVYRAATRNVEVLRVLSGARNVGAVLED